MLLTITTTHRPATDLGYLLHKHPERVQAFDLPFGTAHVFYPEATDERCTAALLLEVDPVGLVRRGARRVPALDQYVNDRPYVASSFMSVAIAQVFGTALGGRCDERPELAATPIPLEARLAVLPCRGGEGLLRRAVRAARLRGRRRAATRSTPRSPSGATAAYLAVDARGEVRLADLLDAPLRADARAGRRQALLGRRRTRWRSCCAAASGWLAAHPERELIARRYLKHQRRG